MYLRVLPKKEWLSLKEEYLRKQKENFTHLKEKLKIIREKEQQTPGNQESSKSKKDNTNEMETVKSVDIERGCIVKLKPIDMVNNASELDIMFKLSQQKFRDEYLKSVNTDIAYVDLDKSTYKMYVRCKSSANTKQVFEQLQTLQNLNQLFQMNLLNGNEEIEYFNRIEQNRHKLQAKKEKKLRGKSKVKIKFQFSHFEVSKVVF